MKEGHGSTLSIKVTRIEIARRILTQCMVLALNVEVAERNEGRSTSKGGWWGMRQAT